MPAREFIELPTAYFDTAIVRSSTIDDVVLDQLTPDDFQVIIKRNNGEAITTKDMVDTDVANNLILKIKRQLIPHPMVGH